MTPQELKASILQYAIQGKLVEQRHDEGAGAALFHQIQMKKQMLIKLGKVKKGNALPKITDEDISFDIPSNWHWVRLGELIRVIGGVSYNKNDVCKQGIRILRGGNIQNMQVFLDEDDVFLPQKYYDEEKQVQPCDILIVASTGSKTVIGKAGYVDRPIPDTMIGAFLRICRPLDTDLSGYLKVIFDSDFYRKHIRELAQGTNINNVKESYITEFAIPLPPVAEQKRIVAKLEEILPLIDRYEAAWNKLEEFNKRFPGDMQKSILQLAIQGKLVEHRPEEGTGGELFQQIQAEKQALIKAGKIKKEKPLPKIADDEIPFDIPEGWEWVRFAELMDSMSTGPFGSMLHKSDYVPKGIPLVNPANIVKGSIVASDKMMVSSETAKRLESYVLRTGMIIMGRRGEMGRCAVVSEKENGWLCGTGSFFMMPSSCVFVHYLSMFFSTPYAKTYLSGASVGTTMSNLNHKILSNMPVPLPPLAEQRRIVAKLEEILPLCERLK